MTIQPTRPGAAVIAAAIAAAFLIFGASPASAQFDRELRWSFALGYGWQFPGALYDQTFDVGYSDRNNPGRPVVRNRTTYIERLDAPWSLQPAVRLDWGEQYFFDLRGRFGGSASTADYSGGGIGPERFERRTSWAGVELIGGWKLGGTGPIGFEVFGGPGWQRWTLDTRGTGRAGVVPAENGAPAPAVSWSDRSWGSVGVVLGAGVRARLPAGFSLGLALEQRAGPIDSEALASLDRTDIIESTGRIPVVYYRPYTPVSTGFSLSLSWTPIRYTVQDPGTRAVASIRDAGGATGGVAGGGEERPDGGGTGGGLSWTSPLPEDVRQALAGADTALAIARLESHLQRRPGDPAVVGGLGVLLALAAPSAAGEWQHRARAEELLERALRMDPGNATYLMALGTVLEKRGMWADARRVLGRALGAAADRPETASPEAIAETLYRRGRALELAVLEFENLTLASDGALLSHPDCGTGFCMNWREPRYFFDWHRNRGDLSDVAAVRRDGMLAQYRQALQLMPAHAGARRGLLGALSRAGDYEGFLRQALEWLEAAPEDPWAAVYVATGHHWRGDAASAEEYFRRALPALPESDRAVFENLRPVLARASESLWDGLDAADRDRFRSEYWRVRDPLHLSPANERLAEHRARVALAELLFGEPQAGERGWNTDRGIILVRYGRPATTWQVRRDDARLASAGVVAGGGGGRWIFWNYDPEEPSFIFEKQLGQSSVSHMRESASQFMAEDMKGTLPTRYRPPFRHAGSVPHQIARFRGATPGAHELEVHFRVPMETLGTDSDSITTGFFLFQRGTGAELVRRTETVAAGSEPRAYRVVLPAGVYDYSVEAGTPALDEAAVGRGETVVGAYSPASLVLSDLLLTSRVRSLRDDPADRRHLDYDGLPCLALPEDRHLGVVFEIYGIVDDGGVGRYRIQVDAGRTPPRGVTVRILRGLRDLVQGAADDPRISFERVVAEPGERVVEWFDLEVPEGQPELDLVVTVTDLTTGDSARAERRLAPEACRVRSEEGSVYR